MTWIKICGITNLEDARTAVDAGADALGFVFWEKSPRKVDPITAGAIVKQLPENIENVGVFVDAREQGHSERRLFDVLKEVLNEVRLSAWQLHSPFEDEPCRREPGWDPLVGGLKMFTVLPAGRIVADEETMNEVIAGFEQWDGNIPELAKRLPADSWGIYFLDAGTPDQPGGTGRTFDWNRALPLVDAMRPKVKVVIAGGLNPDNVGEAIRILRPWGVDVSSGVEARPGKKDPEKVRAFVKAVREAEKGA